MASAVLGKVSPTPKGEYVSTQDYNRLDVVTYEGYPYLAKSNVPSGNLPTDELYWMPLLTGLDFAPGGYGLGMTAKEILDANAAVDNGWYKLTSVNAANAHIPFQYVAIYVTAYSDKYVIQDLYRTNGQNAHMRREMHNGTWGEWEYVNPPLLANVEYRTTERVDGKAVYKKRDSNGVIMYRLDGDSTWTNGLPGAAPSGYGLGLTGSHLTALTDANEAQRNGWYLINKNTANGVGANAIMRVESEAWAHCVQTAYGASHSSSRPLIRQRVKCNGTWSGWVDCDPAAFAPSGYGLGENTARIVSDANAAKTNGFYAMSGASAVNYPNGFANFQYGTLLVEVRYTNSIYQTIKYADISAKRHSQDGGASWSEWAYENPPMTTNVAYLTTERFSGKPVYAKAVYVGTLPNNSTKTVDGVIESGIYNLVSLEGKFYNSGDTYTFTNNENIHLSLGVEQPYAWLNIQTKADFSNYAGFVVIKWTRP